MYIEFLILTCTVRQASLFPGCVTCSLLARAEQLNSFGFLSRQLQIPATSCRSRIPPVNTVPNIFKAAGDGGNRKGRDRQ